MSKSYLLVFQDGTRKHINRGTRDSLLAAKQIKLINDCKTGPPKYKSCVSAPKIRISSAEIGPENVSHPQIISSFYSNLRASRRARADGFHTEQQWMARVEFFGWRCLYCGAELIPETLTKDHQIAIAKGGTEWPSNLVPSCQPCNSWKGTRKVRTFVA